MYTNRNCVRKIRKQICKDQRPNDSLELFTVLYLFFPCFFTAENKHSTGKVKRQIDSFDRTLRICIRAMAYGFSIAFACNENIKDKLTSRPGKVRANLTSCTAKWIVRSQINQTLFIPCIFKLSTKKKNRVSSGDSQRESE